MTTAAPFPPGIAFPALERVAAGVLETPSAELSGEEIRLAVDVCRFAIAWNRKTERDFREWMALGTIGKTLLELMGPYLEVTEPLISRFQAIRSKLGPRRPATQPPDPRDVFISEFNVFVDEATTFNALVKGMVDLASAPRRVPDPEKVRANREAFARGESRPAAPGFMTRRPN
jgi:hypothetical protein